MRLHRLYGLPLLVTAFTATAQPASPPIIVTGELGRDAQLQRYVKALAIPSQSDRIGRFEKNICPLTAGLSDRLNADIDKRLRRVASAAGLRVEQAPCAANVLLVVTPDRKKTLAEWRRTRPILFGRMADAEFHALAGSSDPAVAWQVTEVRGADGRTLDLGRSDSDPTIMSAVTSSRLTPQTRIDFNMAIVVLDADAVKNLTVTQIADYAALRALARTDPDAVAGLGAPTILTLLHDKQAGRPSPNSLTQWDLAYLTSLYGMTNALQAGAQRGEIEKLMRQKLAEAGGSSR